MWHLETGFSGGHDGATFNVEFDDLGGLFQLQ